MRNNALRKAAVTALLTASCLASAAATPGDAPVAPVDSLPAAWQLDTRYFQTTPSDDRWWDTFNDPVLTALIRRAVENNYDVLAAQKRIEAARQTWRAAKGGYYPTLGVSAGWSRDRTPETATGPHGQSETMSYFSLGLTMNWEIDVFGRVAAQAKADKASWQASVADYDATLVSLCSNLAKCTVRAPISGYITLNEISAGNYVNGEAAPQKLATIYDNSLFDARFSIEDDRYRSLIGDGGGTSEAVYRDMPLIFSTPMPHAYTADLYYISPAVDSSTGSLLLSGTVRNIDNELKDGMYVKVSLPCGIEPHAVLVKDAALSTDQLGKYLYVVNDSDKVVYTPVTVGELYHDSLRVIEKGIRPGDRYVTLALLTVRNGMKVRPVVRQ